MGIVDVLAPLIDEAWGRDTTRLLQIYESVYPPDLALKMGEEPGSFDFDIFGGDLGVAGFYTRSSYSSLVQLATQDLLIRIMTNKNTSRLFPSVGNVNISRIPKEGIDSAISIAASESPYIKTINYINVRDIATDEVLIDISAITPTGDDISIGFKY